LTPKQVADKEAFVGAFKPLFPCQLDICPPISRLRDELLKCQDDSDGLFRDLTNKGWLAIRSGNSVKLWLTKHCSVESLLAGYYEACRLRDSFDINVHQSDTSLLIDGIRLAGWNINEIRLCDENQLLVMQNK
jgi:hypothetical protein